jgi:hypothetical protein
VCGDAPEHKGWSREEERGSRTANGRGGERAAAGGARARRCATQETTDCDLGNISRSRDTEPYL